MRAKNNAINKTGHAIVDISIDDPSRIFGRFILAGRSADYDSRGFYMPTKREEAIEMLNTYIKASGDKKLTIRWKK